MSNKLMTLISNPKLSTLNKTNFSKKIHQQTYTIKPKDSANKHKQESSNLISKYPFFMLMSTWMTLKNKESSFIKKTIQLIWQNNSVKNINLEFKWYKDSKKC